MKFIITTYLALFSLFLLSTSSVQAQNIFKVTENQLILPNPILFDLHANDISDTNNSIIDYIANFLKQNSNISKFRIESHVFTESNSTENMKLSMQRAAIVAYYLTTKGIDCGMLTVSGFGDTNPIDSVNTSTNTRVDFYIEKLGNSEVTSKRSFNTCKFFNPCDE
ncbi:MAG: OmpA family protein [Chitinophagales bacterium]|nr:OmpA family protein [Bacteroidota bacterium]